jgi:Ras-related protein Rab-1A
MVYDVSNPESFEHVEEWLIEVNRHASENTIKLLVGNKADLVSQKAVTEEQAHQFADKLGIPFLETSAKNATNVEAAFLTMARELIKAREADSSSANSSGPTVNLKDTIASGKKCC